MVVAKILVLLCALTLINRIMCEHSDHQHENENEDIEKPISMLVPAANLTNIFDQTMIHIIQTYVTGANLTMINVKYEITESIHIALNNTKFKDLLTCFNDMSIDKSIGENLEKLVESYVIKLEFKLEKLKMLKSIGLEHIASNDSSYDSLLFCSNLDTLVTSNYEMVLEKLADRSSLNASMYSSSYENLGVSVVMLKEYIVARYSSDELNEMRIKSMIKMIILSKFDAVNASSASSNEKMNAFINREFDIPSSSNFNDNELPEVFGYLGGVRKAFGSGSYVKDLPGYAPNGTLKHVFVKSIEARSVLERFFNLPLVTAAAEVGILGRKNIYAESLKSLATKKLDIGIRQDQLTINIMIDIIKLDNPTGLQLLLYGSPFNRRLKKAFGSNFVPEMDYFYFTSIGLMPLPGVTKSSLLEQSKKGFAENLPLLVNTLPIPMIASEYEVLAEDFNTKSLQEILMTTLFKYNPELYNTLPFKAATNYYFKKFTARHLLAEFIGLPSSSTATLGGLSKMIENTRGKALMTTILEAKVGHLLVLCMNQLILNEKLEDVLEKCADLDLENADVLGGSLQSFMVTKEFRVMAMMGALKAKNVPLEDLNLRQMVTLNADMNSLMLLKPLKDLVTENDLSSMENSTLPSIFNSTRSMYKAEKISKSLMSWSNSNLPTLKIREIATMLNSNLVQLFALSLSDIVKLSTAISDRKSRIYLPFENLAVICSAASNNTASLYNIYKECIGDAPGLSLAGMFNVRSFNVDEVKLLTDGKLKPSKMDLFTIVLAANEGFDRFTEKTTVPLVLLARGSGISLGELKNGTITATLMKIFKVDLPLIRKVFADLEDDDFTFVSTTPLKDLHLNITGLDKVQELYTGSVQTMAAAVVAGSSPTFEVTKHLPRYVKLISSKTFHELLIIYETTGNDIKDMHLQNVAHHFFGDFSEALFKVSYDVNDTGVAQVKGSTVSNILELITFDKDLPVRVLGHYTLDYLIKYIANKDINGNKFFMETIMSLKGDASLLTLSKISFYKEEFLKSFQHRVMFTNELLKNATVRYLLNTNVTDLGMTFGKNKSEVEKLTVPQLTTMALKYMDECTVSSDACDANANCSDKIDGFNCECKDKYSGNGTTCYDGCATKSCPAHSECIDDVDGPICWCNKGYLWNNAMQTCKTAKRVINMKGMKFMMTYEKAFANMKSKKFLKLADRLERTLFELMQRKDPTVNGVKITSIREGSIIVDADIFVNDTKTDTTTVGKILSDGIKNNELSSLNPSTNFSATFQEINPCAPNPCMEHASCTVISPVQHSCTCTDGYEMDDGECEEEDDTLALKIVLPIVIIILIVVVLIAVFCQMKKHNSNKNYNTSGTDGGVTNPTYENK